MKLHRLCIPFSASIILSALAVCNAKSDGTFPGKGSYTSWINANQFLKFGNDYAQKGEYNKALEWYKKAIQTYEYDSIYYFNLGNAFSLKGQLPIAEQSYRKAIELEPDYFQAWLNLGHTIAKQGRPHEAAEALKQAAQLSQNPEEKIEIQKTVSQFEQLPDLQGPPSPPDKEQKKKKAKKQKKQKHSDN